jgi:hypothetical protein
MNWKQCQGLTQAPIRGICLKGLRDTKNNLRIICVPTEIRASCYCREVTVKFSILFFFFCSCSVLTILCLRSDWNYQFSICEYCQQMFNRFY